MRTRLAAALAIAAFAFAPRTARPGDDDDKGVKITASSVEALRRMLRPDRVVAAETYFATEVKAAVAGLDVSKVRLDAPELRPVIDKVAELYRRGGFEAVKSLAKEGVIPADASKALAACRNAMVQETLASLARQHGEVRVNDFSTAPTAQSDIDQTFFAVEETDPASGRRAVRKDPKSGRPIDGAFLREAFNHEFERLYGIDPDRMEVTSHAREATIPDWRERCDFDEFAVKLARGADALIRNPEAYFLEGAYRRQVDRRSFEGREKLYRILRPLATTSGETAETVVKMRTGETVGVTSALARFEVYRDVRPEWRRGYAFGACVGQLLFFDKHHRPEEVAERAKYLMRSVEDGIASLTLSDGATDRLYFELGPQERLELLQRAHPGEDAARIEWRRRMYDIAEAVRGARNDWNEAAQRKAFAPILDDLAAQKFGPGSTAAAIPAEELAGFLRQASEQFRSDSRKLLVENCVHTAGARVSDWLKPDRIDPEKLPESAREEFRQDPDAFAKRARLAALSELSDAFYVLEPAAVDRIISAETDGGTKAALEDLRSNAQIRRSLTQKRPAVRAKEHIEGVLKQIRENGEGLSNVVPELRTSWQAGYYTPKAVGLRTLYSVKETFGFHFESDFRRLDAAGQKVGSKFDVKKLAGNVASLGGADAMLSIFRSGYDSGWDPAAVAWAAGFQFLTSLPGVSPALAVKGAVFDGEIEGAAVLVAAYFYPGVGQVYMVWNLGKGVLELVDMELTRGVADLLYAGYAPDGSSGVGGFVGRFAPSRLVQDFIASRTDRIPPTVLWFVPGPTLRLKRLKVFEHFDQRLGVKLEGSGLSEEEADAKRRQLAPALFTKVVSDYAELRPGSEFGDDPEIRAQFAAAFGATGGSVLKSYLEDLPTRDGIRDRLVKDYLAGLARRRAEEHQKLGDEYTQGTDEAWELLDRMRDGWTNSRAGLGSAFTLLAGYPDAPDLDADLLANELRPDTTSPGEVAIVVPEEGLAIGDPASLRAEVRVPPGRFTRPFAYEWTFPSLAASDAGEADGLAFTRAEGSGTTIRVAVAVKDARGAEVGRAERTVPIRKPGSETAPPVAKFGLLKLTVVHWVVRGKRSGERADVVTETTWIPVAISAQRPISKALADRVKACEASLGPPTGRDPGTVADKVAGWSVEIDERPLPTPFKATDVPKATSDTKPGAGPQIP